MRSQVDFDDLPKPKGDHELTPPSKPVELVPREIELTIRYRPPEQDASTVDGMLTAVITSRIMTGAERTELSRRAAMWAGGPWANLSAPSAERLWYLAMLSVKCAGTIPKWLEKWAQVDDQLLRQVGEPLVAHEMLYFRPDAGTSNPASERHYVVVDAPALAAAAERPQ